MLILVQNGFLLNYAQELLIVDMEFAGNNQRPNWYCVAGDCVYNCIENPICETMG